ncbi:MAG: dephospho-CoA kinase [Spirochaetes bacterium]|nr:dephospho-CoA kinase [Spirochaetota bacterium]
MLSKCYGLTGSIATGKSTVARMFEELGCHIVDTDRIARQIVEPGQPAYKEIVEQFGNSVIDKDGLLNREKLRRLIIDDPQKRKILNAITHPRIGLEAVRQANEWYKKNGMPIIVDVPLLFETGWNALFRAVILVYVPVDVQLQRLMVRDRLTEEEAQRTLAFQMNIEEKRKLAQYIIDNSKTLEETKVQVRELFAMICANT